MLAVPAGGVILAAAVLAPSARRRHRVVARLQAGALAALLVFGVVGLVHPS